MTLDAALETLALGDAGDIDDLSLLEQIDLEFAAELDFVDRIDAKFPGAATGFDAGFLVVTRHRLGHAIGATRTGNDLYRDVTVGFDCFNLRDPIGLDFDHRDRNRCTIIGKNPGHADFSPYQTERHE